MVPRALRAHQEPAAEWRVSTGESPGGQRDEGTDGAGADANWAVVIGAVGGLILGSIGPEVGLFWSGTGFDWVCYS